jgi:hypothetical protein
MTDLFKLILGVRASLFGSRATLEAKNLVLRQQINVLRRRAPKRSHLNNTDRFLFRSTAGPFHWRTFEEVSVQPFRRKGQEEPEGSRGVALDGAARRLASYSRQERAAPSGSIAAFDGFQSYRA